MLHLMRLLTLILALGGCAVTAPTPTDLYTAAVEALEFQALGSTFSEEQVNSALEGHLGEMTNSQRRAAAILIAAGAIDADDLHSSALAERKLEQYIDVIAARHPALLGRIGDADLLSRLSQPLDYDQLLAASDVLEALGSALSDGVITGYDLRLAGVYDNFPPAQTFIYSHSELLHIRQLVTVLNRENVSAWVYLTPKVSAFLYREDWGGAGDNVVTLPSGTRVVQGKEMAVLFRFDSAKDRRRFQQVVNIYAKRDSREETGLIAGAWWQPFYYTDRPMPEFEPISLVVLATAEYEATLTVVEEKTQVVIDALKTTPWPTRRDRVWVNPAFYRFLNGGYK